MTTVDGGTVSKLQAFTINYLPLPVMTSLVPATGSLNSTVPFTLTGNYFLNGGTVVMLRTVGTTINATPYLTWVNTTTIQGSFAIPDTAGTGPYTLYVITTGGGIQQQTGRIHGWHLRTTDHHRGNPGNMVPETRRSRSRSPARTSSRA